MGVLKAILYNNPSSNALEYGRVNEGNAVNAYTDRKNKLASKVTVKTCRTDSIQDQALLWSQFGWDLFLIIQLTWKAGLNVSVPLARPD